MCVNMFRYIFVDTHVEVRGQFEGVGSGLPLGFEITLRSAGFGKCLYQQNRLPSLELVSLK